MFFLSFFFFLFLSGAQNVIFFFGPQFRFDLLKFLIFFKKNVLGLFFHFSFFFFFFFLFPLFFSRFPPPLPHSSLSTPLFVRAQNLIFFGASISSRFL